MSKIKNKKDKQKIFQVISILFIISCILVYGGRLIYYHNKQKAENSDNSLATNIKASNMSSSNFTNISNAYYFTGNSENNYLEYENTLWRVVKINSDNSVTLVSDKSITSLAYGEVNDYKSSYINKWLNNTDKTNGVLEKQINNKYLDKNEVCLDITDKLNNEPCQKNDNTYYFGLLSIADYINTGADKSFVNTNENFYLSNLDNKNNKWYVSNDSKISTDDGTNIYGVKPVITLKSDTIKISGNGTKNKPYTISEKNSWFNSYVKLGNDTYRVYLAGENKIMLYLNDYLKVNSKDLEYAYGKQNYTYDDSVYGSLAYYLNKTYLNSLSYKNLIVSNSYPNGYYGADNNYNYLTTLKTTVKSKVGLLSVGNVINENISDYTLMTGTNKNGSLVYSVTTNGTLYSSSIEDKMYVIPTITIKKADLTKGDGTKNFPYEME